MPFNPFTIDSPVREIILSNREHLATQNTLIVNTPPGASKSTLLLPALLDGGAARGPKDLNAGAQANGGNEEVLYLIL